MLGTLSFVANVAGSILGGRSKKRAAKRTDRRRQASIRRQATQMREDLLSQTIGLESDIIASAGGTGARVQGAGIAQLRDVEGVAGLKHSLRRERINQQEKEAIAESAAKRKSEIGSANLKMGMDLVSALSNADFGAMSQEMSDLSSFFSSGPTQPFRYTPGNENFRNSFTFKSGIDFQNQSPDYTGRF